MEEMIDAYLSFAAGEGEEPPEETDVVALLGRLVDQTRRAHGFDITLVPTGTKVPAFPLRRKAIIRAFENIISNAISFSTKMDISITYRNDEVTILFDDNGAGIPTELRSEAIRPFVRLETSRNRQTGGTGLGLSITNDIVLGLGGELALRDAPLGGLQVSIRLPV